MHVLSAHIIFSTKRRHPWLTPDVRERIWAYQFPTAKVLEILKKDSSKFAKTLNSSLRDFHWQDGYGLFSVSPSHFEAVRQYILSQEEHHRKETFVGLRTRFGSPFQGELKF